ncbi:BLUF domain-containing protein [Aurantiacibacter zhengii]|uniref:BLUF domain-containing protein n=2 Tax=Aurantiacibacter zhengii TaxID=2307003 RepID=A0A418NSI6_9SPHN|nr:BLUF domain-containing protein [Aurantiacibacter zhengii]
MLAGILSQARRNNARDDITGALLVRHDLYLQLIEGPDAAIDALFGLIAADDRHCDVALLLARGAEDRMFPGWAMLDDEMPSMAWSVEQVADGAIEAAPPEALLGVFARIAAEGRVPPADAG